jgi:7-cyano-7-deazaguanine synthase
MAVWVENRNTIFLSIAAAVAAEMDCPIVIVGFNAEEARNFPDNSELFIDSMNRVLEMGVSKPVRVMSPTIAMSKHEIAAEGLRLDVPWHMIWSCYRDGEMMCGDCESCVRLLRAVSGTEAESKVRFREE